MNWGRIIAFLLTLNVGLLIYILATRNTGLPPASTPGTFARPPASPRSALPLSLPPKTIAVTNDFHWRQLESEDYRSYIQRLRDIGCPESTIHDIVIADLDRLFSPRLRALYPYREDLTYWQPEDDELLNNINDIELLRQERAVEEEKRQVLKELTGIDLATERLRLKGQEDYYDRRLKFLPEERRWEVRRALEDYHDGAWAIRQQELEGFGLEADDRAELGRLRREKEQRLNQLLNPEERRTFDLWLSDTASQVRHDVYGMQATEQEFLTIYESRKQFDEQWNKDELNWADPAVRQRYDQAVQQLDGTLRRSLGEERFQAYQRGQDPEFHALSALASRYNLPDEVASEVYGFKQAFLDYRDAVGYDGRLSPEQKQTTLAAIQEDTLRALRDRLGEVAFNQYLPKADWINAHAEGF